VDGLEDHPGDGTGVGDIDTCGAPGIMLMCEWARLIRPTTAVAAVAAVISYRHAYELVTTHGETGLTPRPPLPWTGSSWRP